jgi:hypothetical protein
MTKKGDSGRGPIDGGSSSAPRLVRSFAWRTAFLAVALCLFCLPAYAYIDPGTGSALVYIVTGIIISAYFAARGLYYKIVELLFQVRFKNRKCNLAVHSEDPRYEITFLPVLRALSERGIDLTYFTMYERGGAFEPLPQRVTHQVIPPGLVGYSFLNHLEAKMLVTTTPQLDVMMFKRSKQVKHYAIISHALGESRFVRPFAYDYFDSVFCCGRLLKENIRRIEAVRHLPAKRLLETGIPHYDELLRRFSGARSPNPSPTVLIAPSWGPMSSFQVFGIGFVRQVAERFNVIVRPHPQMKVSQTALYEEILAMEGVVVDVGPTPDDAMARADILVSDISGLVHEFAFMLEKPVIVVDHEADVGGLEGNFLRDVVSLRELCGAFIVGIKPAEMDSLADVIESTLGQDLPRRITEIREDLVYNWGTAGSVAARQIEELLRCL